MKFSLEDVLEYRGNLGQIQEDRSDYTTMKVGVPASTGYKDGDRTNSIYLGGPKDEPDPRFELQGKRRMLKQRPTRNPIAIRARRKLSAAKLTKGVIE